MIEQVDYLTRLTGVIGVLLFVLAAVVGGIVAFCWGLAVCVREICRNW